MDSTSTKTRQKKAKLKVKCQECGKRFQTSSTFEPKCPKCGSYDIILDGNG